MEEATSQEVWVNLKNLVEYGEYYEVSSFGNVRRIGELNIRKPVKDKNDYLALNFYHNGRAKGYKVHRLVAMAFIPNPEGKPEINHLDSVRDNNKLSNLEWCDRKYNIDHAVTSGNMKGNRVDSFGKWQGEKNASAKLKQKDVFDIADDWNTGLFTYTSLAKKYDMSINAIAQIIKRESWTHLNIEIKHKKGRK